jgi:hypothetical protein
VREVTSLPGGYESIGFVSSSCDWTQVEGSFERLWLVDLDCSQRRLSRALQLEAAAVGGHVLIAKRCSSSGARAEPRVRCTAEVGRPRDGSPRAHPVQVAAKVGPPGTDAAKAALLDDPTGTDAWRIRVDYSRRAGAPSRQPRRTELVGELSVMPVSHVPLGDLMAQCVGDCAADVVRSSVRIAAARIGASDVVAVQCVQMDPGWTCSGTIAGPRRELWTEPLR